MEGRLEKIFDDAEKGRFRTVRDGKRWKIFQPYSMRGFKGEEKSLVYK